MLNSGLRPSAGRPPVHLSPLEPLKVDLMRSTAGLLMKIRGCFTCDSCIKQEGLVGKARSCLYKAKFCKELQRVKSDLVLVFLRRDTECFPGFVSAKGKTQES
ncbi:hypothetical protein L484_010501 [Morus notabilis]|uniref:Uncharacterized protein n=1 Tax=Morus notabilis TaxID=981085 RepID=W9QPK3_9ROSA|nr:hypothetical protein L484_010501 [Morus notabilis]